MSWIERIQNDIVITTGDGKTFSPLWESTATKIKEYNTTQFDFSGVAGSLVTREQPRGAKYLINIYFIGEDNIEQSNEFQDSADDKRAWTISHPLYDRIVVQPVSMNIDNTKMNVTKFGINVIETITDDNPRTGEDPSDKIRANQAKLQDLSAETYANLVVPGASDITESLDTNQTLFDEANKIINNNTDFEEYFNAFNEANSAILNATNDVLSAGRAVQSLINAPALFAQSVRARINTIQNQFIKLSEQITNILSPNQKTTYETNSTGLLSANALASITNTSYNTRSEVLIVVEELNDLYATFLSNMEDIQTDNYNSPDSWLPNYENQLALNELINLTTSKLFDIAVDARQERTIILEKDDNVVNLTHRFYGLDIDDDNLSLFIDTNNIGINEMIQIKKNRQITYLV